MSTSDRHPDQAEQRPQHGQASIIVRGGMEAEMQRLRTKAAMLRPQGHNNVASAREAANALHRQCRLPLRCVNISHLNPTTLLARFDHAEQRERALRENALYIAGRRYNIHPWLPYSSQTCGWPYQVTIYIENLPLHAWSAEGIRQLLGDVCVFDHMLSSSFLQESTNLLGFVGWMKNPDALPRSKVVNFFAERAGRSGYGDGPPGVEEMAIPPESRQVEVLVQLDHYYDHSVAFEESPTSRASGVSSSLSNTRSETFPRFCRFPWARGLLDGTRSAGLMVPRPTGVCRPDIQPRPRDRDPDDQGWPPTRDWRFRGQAQGHPAEDLQYRRVARERFRSPRCGNCGHHHRASDCQVQDESRGLPVERPTKKPPVLKEKQRSDFGFMQSLGSGGKKKRHSDPIILYGKQEVHHIGSGDFDPMLEEKDMQGKTILIGSAEEVLGDQIKSKETLKHKKSRRDLTGSSTAHCIENTDQPTLQENSVHAAEPEAVDIHGPQVETITTDITGSNTTKDQATKMYDFLDRVFLPPIPPLLKDPPQVRRSHARSRSVEPSRRSTRQASNKSTVPVAFRATQRLIKQLDLVGEDEPVGDDAVAKYLDLFKGPLPKQAIEAMRKALNLQQEDVMEANAALASNEQAALVAV